MSEPEYMPILDDRRLTDEGAEARRILQQWRALFTSGNSSPVRSRHIEATNQTVRDTLAFFDTWPRDAPPASQAAP